MVGLVEAMEVSMNRYYVELDNGTVLYVYAYSPEQVKDMLMTYEIVTLDQTD